jgi:fatty acid-binding protein DegV
MIKKQVINSKPINIRVMNELVNLVEKAEIRKVVNIQLTSELSKKLNSDIIVSNLIENGMYVSLYQPNMVGEPGYYQIRRIY